MSNPSDKVQGDEESQVPPLEQVKIPFHAPRPTGKSMQRETTEYSMITTAGKDDDLIFNDFKIDVDGDKNEKLLKKFGHFSAPHENAVEPSSRNLQIGLLEFGPNKYGSFVRVPDHYDFTKYEKMKKILDALGIEEPEVVFHLPRNQGLAPPAKAEEKSVGYWRRHQFKIKEGEHHFSEVEGGLWTERKRVDDSEEKQNEPDGPPTPKHYNAGTQTESSTVPQQAKLYDLKAYANPRDLDDAENKSKIELDVLALFRSLRDFKKSLFLMTHPFKGNRLSELACDGLKDELMDSSRDIPILGLFHTDGNYTAGRLTVVKDFEVLQDLTQYEEEQLEFLDIERKNNAWVRRLQFEKNGKSRIPIPGIIFDLDSVAFGEIPKRRIKVSCDLTDYETEQYKQNHCVTEIPGGLADKCTHRLIFTSKSRLKEFEKAFCRFYATGYFACGSTESEMNTAKYALQNTRPLLVLEGTGFVPSVVQQFIRDEKDLVSEKVNEIEELMKIKKKDRAFKRGIKESKTVDLNDIPMFDFPILKVTDENGKRICLQGGKSLKTIIDVVDEECKSLEIEFDDTLMAKINEDGSEISELQVLKVNSTWNARLKEVDKEKEADEDEDLSDENRPFSVEVHVIRLNSTMILIPSPNKEKIKSIKEEIETALTKLDLKDLLASNKLLIFGLDNGKRINEWNDKASEMIRLSKEEALGQDPIQLFVKESQRERIGQLIHKVTVMGGKETNIEMHAYHVQEPANAESSTSMGIEGGTYSDNTFYLRGSIIPRLDLAKKNIGSLGIFQDHTAIVPRAHCVDTLNRAILLFKSKDRTHHLKKDMVCIVSQGGNPSDLSLDQVKDRFSDLMVKASDNSEELSGVSKNAEVIRRCNVVYFAARSAAKRYYRQAIWIFILIQLILISITFVSAYSLYCGEEEEKMYCLKLENRKENIRRAGIGLPIIAALLQGIETLLRPHKKYAHILLAQQKLESEMYKFRTRIGAYSEQSRLQVNASNNARELFVAKCNQIYDDCMQTEFKLGTFHEANNFWICIKAAQCLFNFFHLHKLKKVMMNLPKKLKNWWNKDPFIVDGREIRPSGPWVRIKRYIMPGARYQKWQSKALRKMAARAENREPDQVVVAKKSNYLRLTDADRNYAERIQKSEEERSAFIKRKNEEAWIKDNCSLSLDDYVELRLKPTIKKFRTYLPRYTFLRNTIECLLVCLTAITTFFGAMEWYFFVPNILAFAAICRSILYFFQLETRCPILHLSLAELEKIEFSLNGPPTLEKRLPSRKRQIVESVEEAILANYINIAEGALKYATEEAENQRKQGLPGGKIAEKIM